eukprot:2671129-Pleurochrysis_carterae.AAC.1
MRPRTRTSCGKSIDVLKVHHVEKSIVAFVLTRLCAFALIHVVQALFEIASIPLPFVFTSAQAGVHICSSAGGVLKYNEVRNWPFC